MYRLVTVG
uniref:Uncharacterized protein n=1 Tax=Arundo donax TaxID=35708 RepID=A0A0A9HXK2_ARUDO